MYLIEKWIEYWEGPFLATIMTCMALGFGSLVITMIVLLAIESLIAFGLLILAVVVIIGIYLFFRYVQRKTE